MTRTAFTALAPLAAALLIAGAAFAQGPVRYGIGRAATPAEIAALDSDVMPDGTGLPAGRGTSMEGAPIYAAKCAMCHGRTGKEGPNDVLVGREPRQGFPFSQDPALPHTIGNYWPYATTIFDYVKRAMPHANPGSLTNDEVYALTAYLLSANGIVPDSATLDAAALREVKMPYRDRFVPDERKGGAEVK